MIRVDREPTARDLRLFGVLWLLFWPGLAALAAWRPGGLLGAAVFLAAAWGVSLLANPLPRSRQLAGVLLPLLLLVAGGAARAGAPVGALAGAAGALGLGGALLIWLRPAVGARVWRGWLRAAEPVGWTVGHIVLGVVYYLVLTPIGLALRLVGYDPMRRRYEPDRPSYWVERPRARDRASYFRQF